MSLLAYRPFHFLFTITPRGTGRPATNSDHFATAVFGCRCLCWRSALRPHHHRRQRLPPRPKAGDKARFHRERCRPLGLIRRWTKAVTLSLSPSLGTTVTPIAFRLHTRVQQWRRQRKKEGTTKVDRPLWTAKDDEKNEPTRGGQYQKVKGELHTSSLCRSVHRPSPVLLFGWSDRTAASQPAVGRN